KMRLVVEDPAEVIAVGKYLGLIWKIGAAGIDEIDAGQPVLTGDLLGAQVFLDSDGIISAAFDRRVVAHDHARSPLHPANAGDQARAVDAIVIHAEGSKRRKLQKRRPSVDQPVNTVAGKKLST